MNQSRTGTRRADTKRAGLVASAEVQSQITVGAAYKGNKCPAIVIRYSKSRDARGVLDRLQCCRLRVSRFWNAPAPWLIHIQHEWYVGLALFGSDAVVGLGMSSLVD